MSKKESKANNGDSNEATKTSDEPGTPAETSETTSETALVPGENKYLQLFVEAQEQCIAKLRTLHDKAEDDDQAGLQRLMKSAQPVVKGREEMAQNWNIPTVRVVYGTTKDPSKPAAAKTGDMYTTDGRIVKQPFQFTPLYIYESNRNFQDGQNAPVCWSPDAKLGTMFGPCNTCPHQPMGKNPTGEKTDCNNGVCMVVMAANWKVYRLEFFKTSRKAGASIDRLVQTQDALWDRWFVMTTQQVSSNGYEYFVFKTAPHGEDLALVQNQACEILYRLIKTERDAFLERHYDQTNTPTSQSSVVDESIDTDAMGMGSDADTNPSDITSGDL